MFVIQQWLLAHRLDAGLHFRSPQHRWDQPRPLGQLVGEASLASATWSSSLCRQRPRYASLIFYPILICCKVNSDDDDSDLLFSTASSTYRQLELFQSAGSFQHSAHPSSPRATSGIASVCSPNSSFQSGSFDTLDENACNVGLRAAALQITPSPPQRPGTGGSCCPGRQHFTPSSHFTPE